jgi:tRNA A37 threonylcarbamoyladenosine dehydratase
MSSDRYQSIVQTFGRDHFDKIQKSRVLVVGAGGIGCEVCIAIFAICPDASALMKYFIVYAFRF